MKDHEHSYIKSGMGHFDKPFTKLCIYTLSFWHSIKVTPNILTTFGLISSILCVYFLYKKNTIACIIFLLLRMYFDYADGLLARKYKQVSKFGDYYDHIVDIFGFFIPFMIVLLITSNTKQKILFSVLIFVFGLFFVIQQGCMEKEYSNKSGVESQTLKWVKKMCVLPEFFKFVDNIVFYIVLVVIIILHSKGIPK
jgi:phosphatidylglycerophosphate synthase